MLGSVLQQAHAATGSRSANPAELGAAGELIPAQLKGAERADYISPQRERLQTLLHAFDSAANEGAAPAGAYDALKKSKSESELEDLAGESIPEGSKKAAVQSKSRWGGGVWGGNGEKPVVDPAKKTE